MPQTFSPNIGDDLAGFLNSFDSPAVAVLERNERTTTNAVAEKIAYRVEFKCQGARHYCRLVRGRAKNRTAESGNFKHLGLAEVVVQERGGFYGIRWDEYRRNHRCSYA